MRRIAIALIACGLAVAVAGGSLALVAWTGQTRGEARWEGQAVRGGAGTQPLTRLSFPEQGKEFIVREGTTEKNLLLGPARVDWSAVPGGEGNSIIAAHRDTHFRMLKDVRRGELINVERGGNVFHYRIVGLEVVPSADTTFYRVGKTPTLTLVTCYPFYYLGPAPKRFIVRAELLDPNS